MKFKEYVEALNKMLNDNPELGDLEMEQTERWDDEEVRLPWREENSKYYYLKGIQNNQESLSLWYNLGCVYALEENFDDAYQCMLYVALKYKDIFETIKYVVESSNKFKKDKFMGLYGLPLLNFGYSFMPHAVSEEIIKPTALPSSSTTKQFSGSRSM